MSAIDPLGGPRGCLLGLLLSVPLWLLGVVLARLLTR